jgi:dTDP-4-amino-4,6-dideoxygalactose transaminase
MVWADVDPETGLIAPESIVARITARTKAIIVVDWGGRPVDCFTIRKLLPRVIPIIQDAAHSFGALSSGGNKAHAGIRGGNYVCYSFQPIKHLTVCGDGGALHAPYSQFDRARALRWFGIDRETKAKFRFLQDIPEAGYKFHLADLPAACGLANFQTAVDSLEKHRAHARWLYVALADCRVVKRPPYDDGSSWWFYSLRTPKPLEFVDFAEQRGVGAGPVHGRCDKYSGFSASHYPLPCVDAYYSQHVAIPCGWWLSKEDLERIAETVLEWDKTL